MGSIDFNLPIREQLYVLPNTDLITKEEKDIILEFVWIQYTTFFRKESINRTLVGSKYSNRTATKRDVENIIKGGRKKGVTFQIAIEVLLTETNKLQSKQLIKRVEKLKETLQEQDTLLDCNIMTGTHYTGFSDREKQIATIMAFIESSIMLDMMPVSEAAEIIGVNDVTIRQACQDARVIARKFNNGWSVCLSECKEYWEKKNKRGETNEE